MIEPKRIVCIVGTRPEAIKLCPVILHLKRARWAEVIVVATGQHRDLLHRSLGSFGVQADFDFDVMTPDQSLSGLTARVFEGLDPCLARLRADMLLAQGDTTSAMVAAITCFYRGIPFGHVEAGLRTGDLRSPFPEEFNRRVAAMVTSLHFAPTETARSNLEDERIAPESIFVTGNTVIDALYWMKDRIIPRLDAMPDGDRLALLTAHRRENLGVPLRGVFEAVLELTRRHPELRFLFPVHPNPVAKRMAEAMLGGQPQIQLCPPLDYPDLVRALVQCDLILTDSGGLQEEGPALSKPVLVIRNETERPEAIAAGVARLVGTDRDRIVHEVSRLLSNPQEYRAMARGISPYGDGKAAQRICGIIHEYLLGGGIGMNLAPLRAGRAAPLFDSPVRVAAARARELETLGWAEPRMGGD